MMLTPALLLPSLPRSCPSPRPRPRPALARPRPALPRPPTPQQWRWYRVGDLDPKFRYFMAILMVNMLLTVIVGALYATSFDLNSTWYALSAMDMRSRGPRNVG